MKGKMLQRQFYQIEFQKYSILIVSYEYIFRNNTFHLQVLDIKFNLFIIKKKKPENIFLCILLLNNLDDESYSAGSGSPEEQGLEN